MKRNVYRFIYAGIYLLVGVFAIFVSMGVFTGSFYKDFYWYYTNISNYLCILYVLVEFIYNLVMHCKNKTINFITIAPRVKFALSIDVLLTFLVANTILGPQVGFIWNLSYWKDLINPFLHLCLPIMFIVDYLIMSDHRVTPLSPLGSLILPLLYLTVIYIRAFSLPKDYTGMRYPYPFVDLSNGVLSVAAYILALIIIFLVIGYGFLLFENRNKK